MDRDPAVRLVNAALSREYNSVAAYALHSSPYTVDEDAAALKAFEEIHAANALTAAWLTERLREDLSSGPTLRAFEHWKVDLNYLSVPYLVRFAHEHYGRVAAEYEETLRQVAGDAALEAIFRRLRDEAKSHRAAMDKVLSPPEPGREGAPRGVSLPDVHAG